MYLETYLNLEKNLVKLKNKFKLYGLKGEFEAEGSSFEDISKLRNLTSRNKIKLFVKIGGVEALNDIYQCIDIGVDGIIAPMVESKFAVKKFIDSIQKLKIKKKPSLTINIETASGVKNFNEIFKQALGNIDNITIGRSDLAASYFNKNVTQNSNKILQIILKIGEKIKKKGGGVNLCVGGGINRNTILKYQKHKNISLIKKMETRKVILPTFMMFKKNALESALEFETNYILYKKEVQDFKLKSEIDRLSNLGTRK
jgi:4-hydroxy-2-oxoheptanedioate aldolase